jgi:acetyltransferase-like isoleucine patch superfamily enzyme
VIRIGRGAKKDPGVTVGYKPSRKIADMSLVVGAEARLRSGTILYLGSRIGAGFETGHNVVIREENEIGDGVQVWSNSIVDYGCVIGDGAHIHSNVYVAQFSRIGRNVFVAPGVVFLNDPHPGCICSRQCMRGPEIGDGAIIGGGCVIMPFVKIGAGALVGAGSLVTKDIPASVVAYGSPARVRGRKTGLKCVTGHVLKPYPAQ